MPVIYSGDEIAQLNDTAYHSDPLKKDDSRYLHRGRLNWRMAEQRHNSDTVQGKVFAAIRHLEDARAAHPVFDTAADVWLLDTGNEHILGIGRYFRGEKLVGLFNFAAQERTICVNELGEYRDLLSGEAVDKFRVVLPSGGFAWLLCDFGEPEQT